eukprot:TRINITY_DN1174_c0_g4_i1.p2 TRINITY_DN1174_c0_g4~~TRINITY_DN1174_c0_g4_i1.p2  ORF type:complete len:102 (-),score=22.33 TRINITY_DN1174_c0_g4_i1:126-431(-)
MFTPKRKYLRRKSLRIHDYMVGAMTLAVIFIYFRKYNKSINPPELDAEVKSTEVHPMDALRNGLRKYYAVWKEGKLKTNTTTNTSNTDDKEKEKGGSFDKI